MSRIFGKYRFRNPMRIESLQQRIGVLVLLPVGFMFDFKGTSGVVKTG